MTTVHEIWNFIASNAAPILKEIWHLVQYVPEAQRERVAFMAEVFSYLVLSVTLGLTAYKLYRAAINALNRASKWTGGVIDAIEGIVRDGIVAVCRAAFRKSTYSAILEWCSMTDAEAMEKFKEGTKPRHAQRLLGFMVFLAGTYACLAAGVAVAFVLQSQDVQFTASTIAGIGVCGVLFGAIVFSFDRSIAGAGELIKYGPGTLNQNIHGVLILATRIALSLCIAGFVAKVLTILLFYASILHTLQIASDVQAKLHLARISTVEAKLVKMRLEVTQTPACKQLEGVVAEFKIAMEEEANIKDKDGNGRKQRYERKREQYLEKQGEYKESCGPNAMQTPNARMAQDALTTELEDARSALAQSKIVKIDIGSGARAIRKMQAEGSGEAEYIELVYRLIFGLELALLAVKLTLSSSYGPVLERLEHLRAYGVPPKAAPADRREPAESTAGLALA